MLFILFVVEHTIFATTKRICNNNMNKTQSKIFASLLKPLFMAFTMSFVMLLINVGLFNGFLSKWMKGFAIGYIVAVPTSMLAAKITDVIINMLKKKNTTT